MKILLVGGAGHVGTFITPYLQKQHQVRVLDMMPPTAADVEYCEGSIADPEALRPALEGCDTFINLVMKGGFDRAKFIPPGVMGAIPGMTTMATGMMKKKIEKANIPSLGDLQEVAQIEGVELIACKMTVDMMELDESKLIEGVVVWTAEDFLKYAKECKLCLFT